MNNIKSCSTCIFRNKYSECTANSFAEGGPKLIHANCIETYMCRHYQSNINSDRILNESRLNINERKK